MTPLRWIVVAFFVALFLFAKAWVIKHPVGLAAAIIGAALLILSESANAGTVAECKMLAGSNYGT